ncbi:omega-amidase NIT2-like [Varroa jacobsoni]|uniref:omega-amidase NIT2-like n=1 Tax=Varroa jacobsoni TaxID=62625 RepID=UPI000BF6F90A|nr:omega-amidase NIT2-like [Varroa jacobsoni]XP_022691880.1 omega-amidase NIT2-like [Varroa jacobsoni]
MFRLACLQLSLRGDKTASLAHARAMIDTAVKGGAQLVCLSECFAFPYGPQYFRPNAETIPEGETCKMLKNAAVENKVFVVGGSLSEKDSSDRLYNTCVVFDPKGTLVAKHRKVHLFDIDIPGKITFKESESFTAGDTLTTFDTPFCKVGLGICYDIRFAPMAQLYRARGCQLLLYPGAFNMITGPLNWELLCRARAVDNQLYVAGISPARDPSASYVAFGHTMVVGPRGTVIAQTQEKEDIVYANIELDEVTTTRENIPIGQQVRTDLYKIVDKKPAL